MTTLVVLTVDQRGSRRRPDLVPEALAVLAAPPPDGVRPPVLPAERTAGDEIQTVLPDATTTVLAVERLTRIGGWRIGVGIGQVETPLPDSTRAARGTAFLAAREAVTAARGSAAHLAVRAEGAPHAGRLVGGWSYGALEPIDAAEHALTLLVTTSTRRTEAGWEIVDLMDEGLNGKAAAARLGISESAVSQRLARAGWEEGLRARSLCVDLLVRAGVSAP